MKKLIIRLKANGSRTIEAEGFSGPSCKEASAFLNKVFGDPSEEVLKPEYYEEEYTLINRNFEPDGLPELGEDLDFGE